MATLAESVGATRPQERSNVDNFDRLNEYYLRYKKINMPILQNMPNNRASASSPQQKPLSELIDGLKASVNSSKSKNVEVLQLAAQICRQMKGKFRKTSRKLHISGFFQDYDLLVAKVPKIGPECQLLLNNVKFLC